MVRAAYQVLLAGQKCIQMIAQKTLGEPSRHAFTIDGKMLGDLGELVACLEFGLTPLPTNTPGIDAKTRDNENVEIKATAGENVWIPARNKAGANGPKHVVVVKFNSDGNWTCPFHGELEALWDIDESIGKHQTLAFGIGRLVKIQSKLLEAQALPPLV